MRGDEARDLATGGDLDYDAIGFKCGLEIHQQLDTHKLFCSCPSTVADPDHVGKEARAMVDRRLRATQSELGEVDVAALEEAKRQKSFRYIDIKGASCLVEWDEEPPHRINEDALDITLTLAALADSDAAGEVHVMRKTVIDGSNTSGFQRTALVATGGELEVQKGNVSIWTIAVEEDSARKWKEDGGVVTYTLDRLGIPLIEIATGPDIQDPQHAKDTAARIGALLRATGRVKRGLGSIRQDLNVSVGVGDRVEIKGCQDLRAIPRVIENEVRRQLWLHHIAESLRQRHFDPDSVGDPVDVGEGFAHCDSKIVAGAIGRGGSVFALGLPQWSGLIGGKRDDGPRMGREFADQAKQAAGVKGVFHSDELPAYGITDKEVEATASALGLAEGDGFVLCVEKEPVARRALEAVADRARRAMDGALREVRAVQPDDSTRYMRPLPGSARMYPETDIPPTRITEARWQRILDHLPAKPEEQIDSLQKEHGLSQDISGQLVREGLQDAFADHLAAGAKPALAARVLLQILPDLQEPDRVEQHMPDIYHALGEGGFAKEAIPDILKALDDDPQMGVAQAVEEAGAGAADDAEVVAIIEGVVQERREFVKERGMGAMGPLMGPVMAELRGKADGSVVSGHLQKAIQEVLKDA